MADDDINSFLVRRNKDGDVEPYEVSVFAPVEDPETKETKLVVRQDLSPIKILPTTLGSLKGLKSPEGDAVLWDVKDKIKYVREHVVEPDFGSLSEEDFMLQMTMYDLDCLVITAVVNGGPLRPRKEKKKGPTKRSGRSKSRSH